MFNTPCIHEQVNGLVNVAFDATTTATAAAAADDDENDEENCEDDDGKMCGKNLLQVSLVVWVCVSVCKQHKIT